MSVETPLEKSKLSEVGRSLLLTQSPERKQWFRRALTFARHSFALRAALVMCLGTAMSCTSCNTCISLATLIGCDMLSDSASSGCGSDDEEEEDVPRLELVCDDGVDQDEDGDTDCEDIDCQRLGACGEYYCYDGLDDDRDGLVDCDDEECCHYEWCRCHCEAQCEEGATLCISDEESCDYECCPTGQECVDGRCSGCETECSSGYVPCWTGDELCAHQCCTPGQECGDSGCHCPMECSEGTNPCLIDEWTCTYACCGGKRSAAVAVARHTPVQQRWRSKGNHQARPRMERLETHHVSGMDGCSEGSGTEALLEVVVPPVRPSWSNRERFGSAEYTSSMNVPHAMQVFRRRILGGHDALD